MLNLSFNSSGTYSLSQTSQLQENYVVVFW